MIADELIEKVATDRRIKPAVTELVNDLLSEKAEVRCNKAEVTHDFECEVHGQKIDVKISFSVATKKKR